MKTVKNLKKLLKYRTFNRRTLRAYFLKLTSFGQKGAENIEAG